MTSKTLMLKYLLNNHVMLQNDVVELRNTFVYRQTATVIECTELTIALSKLELFEQIFSDIMNIYKITPEDIEKLKG